MAEPTAAQAALIKTAIVAKAARLLALPGSPFGVSGEGEWGFAIRPDYTINEMLYGLRYKDLEIDDITVTTTDVINALGTTAENWSNNQTQLELALAAATAWVEEALEGLPVA